MKKLLFREEVINQQVNRLHGEVMVVPNFSHSTITIFLFLWVFFVIIWLSTSTYAKKEKALGWLEPSGGVVNVYPNIDDNSISTVKKVLINEGNIIKEGQSIIVIEEGRTLVNGADLEGVLLNEYNVQQNILIQQISRSKKTHTLENEKLQSNLSTAKEQSALLSRQIQTLQERYSLFSKEASKIKKLILKGNASESEEEQINHKKLSILSDIQSLQSDQINLRSSIGDMEIELELSAQRYDNVLDDLESKLSSIKLAKARLEGEQAYIIKAPRSGRVSSLQAREGVTPQQGVPLLSIIPQNVDLIAHLLVPVRSVAYIEPGQLINIQYDAFPYQKFGVYEGEIISITNTILLPSQLAESPVSSTEPVYLVTASIKDQSIRTHNKVFPLKSGMTFSSDIVLGVRTLIRWVFEPIYSLRGGL